MFELITHNKLMPSHRSSWHLTNFTTPSMLCPILSCQHIWWWLIHYTSKYTWNGRYLSTSLWQMYISHHLQHEFMTLIRKGHALEVWSWAYKPEAGRLRTHSSWEERWRWDQWFFCSAALLLFKVSTTALVLVYYRYSLCCLKEDAWSVAIQ